MPTSSSAFVVNQISRQREIKLYDRALPYRPFTLRGMQRVEVEWPAGYAEGTATVMGPTLEPTTVTGMWKAKYLEDPNLPAMVEDNGVGVFSVDQTITIFNTFRREGLLLRVTWGNTVRKGFLKMFEVNYLNMEDIQWSMEFVWINEGEETVPVVLPQTSSTQGAATRFTQAAARITAAANAAPYGQQTNFRQLTQGILDRILGAVQSARNTLTLQVTVAIRPLDATRRVLAITNTVISATTDLRQRYEYEVPGASSTIPIQTQTPAERLNAQINSRLVVGESAAMRYTAIEQALDMATNTTTQILALYKAREGDDLRRVARTYYNNEKEWRRLLTFNLLDSSVLTAGQLIFIPDISQLDSEKVA
jgi:hypothetical protein